MKFLGLAPVLLVMMVALPGCGSSSESAFCKDVSTVKTQVQTIKSTLKSSPSVSTLKPELQTLASDINKAIGTAKSSASPQIDALKSSVSSLKTTITQVFDKKMSITQALPTLKTQAEAVQTAWQSLTSVEKC